MEKKTKLSELSARARIEYIWDYYKVYIFTVLFIIMLVVSLGGHYLGKREPFLNVLIVNSQLEGKQEKTGFEDFFEAYGYELYEGNVSLNRNVSTVEDTYYSYANDMVLTTLVSASGEDIAFWTEDAMGSFASRGAFVDLSEVLSEETMDKYKDSLIYTDENGTKTSYPYAIVLEDNGWIVENQYYQECNFSIFAASENLETAIQFAEYLLEF